MAKRLKKYDNREKFRQALADLNHDEATVYTHWELEAYDKVHCPELRENNQLTELI